MKKYQVNIRSSRLSSLDQREAKNYDIGCLASYSTLCNDQQLPSTFFNLPK